MAFRLGLAAEKSNTPWTFLTSIDQGLALHATAPSQIPLPTAAAPALAAAITAAKETVLVEHAHELRTLIPGAASLSLEAATGNLGLLLDGLTKAFHDPRHWSKVGLLAPGHAAARLGQNFSAAEAFQEYALFRRILERQVKQQLGRPLTEWEKEILHTGLDSVIAGFLVSFARQQESRLQLENNALNDYLSSVAHDVRNEANGLLMVLQIAELNAAELEAGRRGTEKLEGQVSQLRSLLRELNSSRGNIESTMASLGRVLEADRMNTLTVTRRTTALRPLLEGISRSAERIARSNLSGRTAREIRSRISINCPNELIVDTDPDLLSTVLTNVVGNAVKYSEGKINLSAEGSGEGYKICVADAGPGMLPDQCHRIFGKFERAGRSNGEGFGLGLYTAKKAAKLLEAELSVASELGKGTCVTVAWKCKETLDPSVRPLLQESAEQVLG